MAFRDLLQAQTEQMGKALGRLLEQFLDLKSTGNMAHALTTTDEKFHSLLDCKVADLADFSEEELTQFIQDKKLTDEHLEKISELLVEWNLLNDDDSRNNKTLEQAVRILEHANFRSQTLSFSRMNMIKEIKKLYPEHDEDNYAVIE